MHTGKTALAMAGIVLGVIGSLAWSANAEGWDDRSAVPVFSNGTISTIALPTTGVAAQGVMIKAQWSGSEAYANFRVLDESTGSAIVARWVSGTTSARAFSSQGGGAYAQGSGGQYAWSNDTNGNAGSLDTGMKRLSAAVVSATNGGSGDGRFASPGAVMDVGTTCNKGEVLLDTGGATVEICACTATNTLRCVPTATTNPAD